MTPRTKLVTSCKSKKTRRGEEGTTLEAYNLIHGRVRQTQVETESILPARIGLMVCWSFSSLNVAILNYKSCFRVERPEDSAPTRFIPAVFGIVMRNPYQLRLECQEWEDESLQLVYAAALHIDTACAQDHPRPPVLLDLVVSSRLSRHRVILVKFSDQVKWSRFGTLAPNPNPNHNWPSLVRSERFQKQNTDRQEENKTD